MSGDPIKCRVRGDMDAGTRGGGGGHVTWYGHKIKCLKTENEVMSYLFIYFVIINATFQSHYIS